MSVRAPLLATDRDGFSFRGGHPVLDLTATVLNRTSDRALDLLATPDDLRRWLVSSGVATAVEGVTHDDLLAVRRLREAFFALSGATRPKWAIAAVNAAAGGPPASLLLGTDGAVVRQGSAAEHLAALAREGVALFGSDAAARVRRCEGEGCAKPFLDNSRKGDRRWCSMRGCGNRAKVAAFRERGRAANA